MIYDNKTTCFVVKESIFSPRRDSLLLIKTTCFVVMMIYDAFVRRVISSNKLVFNKLAPIMMLLRKNTFKKVKLGANGPWGG